jgi:hypothetical protein
MMISCKKATELIDKKIFRRLSLKERTRLLMHKTLCDACSLYEKQSHFIHNALKKNPELKEDDNITTPEELSRLQSRIIHSLDE